MQEMSSFFWGRGGQIEEVETSKRLRDGCRVVIFLVVTILEIFRDVRRRRGLLETVVRFVQLYEI
jgi:hypothetical protein